MGLGTNFLLVMGGFSKAFLLFEGALGDNFLFVFGAVAKPFLLFEGTLGNNFLLCQGAFAKIFSDFYPRTATRVPNGALYRRPGGLGLRWFEI